MPKNNCFLACPFLFQSFSIALFWVYNLYKIKMQLTAQPRTKKWSLRLNFHRSVAQETKVKYLGM